MSFSSLILGSLYIVSHSSAPALIMYELRSAVIVGAIEVAMFILHSSFGACLSPGAADLRSWADIVLGSTTATAA